MFDEKMKKMLMGEASEMEQESAPIGEEEIMAKMQILEELRDQMAELMASKMQGDYDEMQKVTIAAKSPEGLEQGLEKAEEVVEKTEADFHDEEDEELEDEEY